MNSMSVVGMFPHSGTLIPRFREAGYVTLDLLHRDGRIEDRWIGLSQREFELVWRVMLPTAVPNPYCRIVAGFFRPPLTLEKLKL